MKIIDGSRFASPQKILDAMTGRLSFDPLAFARMKPLDQLAQLKTMLGLDFAALDARRRAAFDKRTDVARQARHLEAQVQAMPPPPETPPKPVDVAQLGQQLREARAHNGDVRTAKDKLDGLRQSASRVKQRIADLEQELEDARRSLDEINAQGIAARDRLAALVPEDEDGIVAAIAGAEATNKLAAQEATRASLEGQAATMRVHEQALSAEIASVDADKAARIAAVDLPVPGLQFGEESLLYRGLPLAQASSAEQLRVSVAVGMRLNPQVRVCLVRDGSLLDAESLAMLRELADTHDHQLWIERVSEGAECSVIIEDGEVAA